jgi:hypothetical protein
MDDNAFENLEAEPPLEARGLLAKVMALLPPHKALVIKQAIIMTPIPPLGYWNAIGHAANGLLFEPLSEWYRGRDSRLLESSSFPEHPDYSAFDDSLCRALNLPGLRVFAPVYAGLFSIGLRYGGMLQTGARNFASRLGWS